jgi:hypothetical protein
VSLLHLEHTIGSLSGSREGESVSSESSVVSQMSYEARRETLESVSYASLRSRNMWTAWEDLFRSGCNWIARRRKARLISVAEADVGTPSTA